MDNGELLCVFRHNVRHSQEGEIASCGLIESLLRDQGGEFVRVSRAACLTCRGRVPIPNDAASAVFPSIVNEACLALLAGNSGSDPSRLRRARELAERAENAVEVDEEHCERLDLSCDVFVHCMDDSEGTHRSILSILGQKNVTVFVHLVIEDAHYGAVADRYAQVENVKAHRVAEGFFSTVHNLVPKAETQVLAFQHGHAESMPYRIAGAILEMRRTGCEIAGGGIVTPEGEVTATQPTEVYEPVIPWPTLVMRRSKFIDLGGFADRETDQDVEFLFRAKQSGSGILLSPLPTVFLPDPWGPPGCEKRPEYHPRYGSMRRHAVGYPEQVAECDVVISVYGKIEFVSPSIESILNQVDAKVVLHLIDDCGPEDVTDLFRTWESHPQVRLYRNTQNIGQYASFNNVSEFFETEFVAIQDSDDLSLPERVKTSVSLLHLSDADYFAATMEQFGEGAAEKKIGHQYRFRKSCHPYGKHHLYFAMNPTACFRTSMFRSLGGYTDFGSPRRNRTGLDSEFMIRAYYSGVRFAISSDVVTRHRIHDGSLTQRGDTGFGSEVRKAVLAECRRRMSRFREAHFDPRAFGGIGKYRSATQRLGA